MSEEWVERDFQRWFKAHGRLPFRGTEPERRVVVVREEVPLARVVDLTAVDEHGTLVLIEVKNERSGRRAIGQLLEYLANIGELRLEDIYEGPRVRVQFQEAYDHALDRFSTSIDAILAAPAFDIEAVFTTRFLNQAFSALSERTGGRRICFHLLQATRAGEQFHLRFDEREPICLRDAPSFVQTPGGRLLVRLGERGGRALCWYAGRKRRDGGFKLAKRSRICEVPLSKKVLPGDPGPVEFAMGHIWVKRGALGESAIELGIIRLTGDACTAMQVRAWVRLRPGKTPELQLRFDELERSGWQRTNDRHPDPIELIWPLASSRKRRAFSHVQGSSAPP